MKKLMALILAMIMVFALAACGNSGGEASDEAASSSSEISLETLKLKHGDLVDVTVNDTTLIIKAKIKPNMTNELTIDQNYYNVCDLIKTQGCDQYDAIQYWAVADMQDGSEGKVISFDVNKDTIDMVADNSNFPDNTLGQYVENLWILPSLTE